MWPPQRIATSYSHNTYFRHISLSLKCKSNPLRRPIRISLIKIENYSKTTENCEMGLFQTPFSTAKHRFKKLKMAGSNSWKFTLSSQGKISPSSLKLFFHKFLGRFRGLVNLLLYKQVLVNRHPFKS